MTNDEAAALVNGEGGSEVQTAGNSEPRAQEVTPKEQPATVAADPKPNKDAVNPAEAKAAAPETAADGKKKDSKKDFYSQERAAHAFARENRKVQRLMRENDELKAQLEKFKGTTRDSFVDKVSGKLDEEKYVEFVSNKAVAEARAKQVAAETEEIQDEVQEAEWYDRVSFELGDEADKFNAFCTEEVGEDGETRYEKFIDWLEKHDPKQVAISRLNSSKNRVRLLRELMTNKDARMSVVSTNSPYKMEMALDAIEDRLNGATAPAAAADKPKASFADSWRNRPKETKPEKPKPTGSAFAGDPKSTGKEYKDNNYFASLL